MFASILDILKFPSEWISSGCFELKFWSLIVLQPSLEYFCSFYISCYTFMCYTASNNMDCKVWLRNWQTHYKRFKEDISPEKMYSKTKFLVGASPFSRWLVIVCKILSVFCFGAYQHLTQNLFCCKFWFEEFPYLVFPSNVCVLLFFVFPQLLVMNTFLCFPQLLVMNLFGVSPQLVAMNTCFVCRPQLLVTYTFYAFPQLLVLNTCFMFLF